MVQIEISSGFIFGVNRQGVGCNLGAADSGQRISKKGTAQAQSLGILSNSKSAHTNRRHDEVARKFFAHSLR